MRFSDRFAHAFRTVLPSPFTIAVLLTAFVFICALLFTGKPVHVEGSYIGFLSTEWFNGLWNAPLLVFAFQMMFMLVLGHAVALSKPVDRLLGNLAQILGGSNARAAWGVTLVAVLVAWVNWGLGLIVGAVFARKMGEQAAQTGTSLNYALIGACGYAGLMVWHGGISGSSLVKIVEKDALRDMAVNTGLTADQLAGIPESMTFSETVFSGFNLGLTAVLIVILPLVMAVMGRRKVVHAALPAAEEVVVDESEESRYAAEKLDSSRVLCLILALLVLTVTIFLATQTHKGYPLAWLTPNWINGTLFGLALLLHGSFKSFFSAIDKAIGGASGILIQFPLYFGILGLMKASGMITGISDFFVSISDASTYPLVTFFSAGLVNIFVPSGGGQWAVQGPIIIEAATNLGVPLNKGILAMAYGDQLTNMLQPFWALPLLSITGLKARDILPYTLVLMLVGMMIFGAALLI